MSDAGLRKDNGTLLTAQDTYLRFSPQNEQFQDVAFTGFILKLGFDKFGDIVMTIKATWEFKESLIPNLTYGTGMPLQFTVKPYDGRTKEELSAEPPAA